MIKIVKLTLKNRVEIIPQSTPILPVNEEVSIPVGSYGKFYIRKKLAKLGLILADLPFHQNQTFVPEIIVHAAGVNTVELNIGEEIGELWIQDGVVFEDNP